jgi:hypothetical protein
MYREEGWQREKKSGRQTENRRPSGTGDEQPVFGLSIPSFNPPGRVIPVNDKRGKQIYTEEVNMQKTKRQVIEICP